MVRFTPEVMARMRHRLETEQARKHPDPSIISMCQLYLQKATDHWAGMRSHASATHPKD